MISILAVKFHLLVLKFFATFQQNKKNKFKSIGMCDSNFRGFLICYYTYTIFFIAKPVLVKNILSALQIATFS